jgi:TolB-like protein/tetratricopeptide (TPR) repeat protein
MVEEANLTVTVSKLRKALGESPTHRYIETVPRRGFRFIASVNEVCHPTAGLQNGRRSQPTETCSRVKAIAVLPFKSLSPDENDDYLGLGVADTLITKLSGLQQIIVRPTSAVRKYAGLEHDWLAAGREQRVDAVLEGSIHRLGDRLRVTIRLVRIKDGSPLWAEKFDEPLTDPFAVQDSIAERVAPEMMPALTGQEKKRRLKQPTDNTEAFQLCLKGRFYWNKRTGDSLKKSIAHLQQAIEKDPTYAVAYAGLADCYNLLGLYGVLPPRQAMPRAKAAALKALEIDDTLAEAHTSLAYAKLYYDWDWVGAEQGFQQALALNPNYATAHHWYHEYLVAMRRFEEDRIEIRRAQELDPLSLIINTDVGWGLYFARCYDQAIEQLGRTLDIEPGFAVARLILGQCYQQKGLFDDGVAETQKAITLLGDSPPALAIGALGHTYAVSGRRAEALKALQQLRERSQRRYVPAYSLAIIYAGLGEKDQAFAWLQTACEERYDRLIYLNVDPLVDSLRADPRFTELRRRVGLVAQPAP